MDQPELITRARRGDEAAWATLVGQYQEVVFRLAYLLCGDADEAEDVAQEAFIRAYYALDQFDDARPLRPWLLRITANLAHNRRRAVGRYLAALRRLFQADPDALVAALPETATQEWEAQTLWQAVRRLNKADQEIIYLRYFLELSVDETAASLQIAPGTVKSRLSRAMDRLRTVVERDFPALAEGRGL
jgi:RNA polymerase sigma-70 factor (ECF subfamily)